MVAAAHSGARLLLLVLRVGFLVSAAGPAADEVTSLWDRYSATLHSETARDTGSAALSLRTELTRAIEAATERGDYGELQLLGLGLRKTEADFSTQVGAAQDMYDDFSTPVMRAFAALLERTAVHPACVAHFRNHAVHESRCSTIRAWQPSRDVAAPATRNRALTGLCRAHPWPLAPHRVLPRADAAEALR